MSRFPPPRILGLTILSDEKQPNLAYKGGYDIVSLQILKAICAFFVVQIHTWSFYKIFLEPACRIAVPIFLIITGYFLLNKDGILTTDRIKRTFIKILKITIAANIFYFIFRSVFWLQDPDKFMDQVNNAHIWLNLFTLGYSFCRPLWYMNALLQALIVLYICLKLKLLKYIPAIAIIGILANLTFGEFEIDSFGLSKDFINRNVFFTTIPCLFIGMLIRLNEHLIKNNTLKLHLVVAIIAFFFLYTERLYLYKCGHIHGEIHIFTIPCAIKVFLLALKLKIKDNLLAKIGRDHSFNIYIFHIFVKDSLRSAHLLFEPLATIQVFFSTLIASIAIMRVKKLFKKMHNRSSLTDL